MKKIFIISLLLILLSSCWEEVIDENWKVIVKQDFGIQTEKLSSFSWSYEIKKTWKIKPTQDIILKSKAGWIITNIPVKFWDKVFVWKNLINLWDNISNYGLNLEKAWLWLESSKLNYESTEISLDKQVSDAEISLAKIEKDHEILVKKLAQTVSQAKIDLDNSLAWMNTWTWFTSKAELDYNNLVKNNKEQIKIFETTSKNDYLKLKNLYTDIINFSDWLLWVTFENKGQNDSFEDYLWLKNRIFTKDTELKLLDIISFKKDNFDKIEDTEISISNLDELFIVWNNGYPLIISFMDDLEKVLDYSIENVNFTRSQIDWYKATINWYQTSLSTNYSWFLSFTSNVDNFLNTFEDNEKTLKKQLEIAWDNSQINYNKIILDVESSLNTSETSLKNAKLNLDNLIKNREVTLKQLQNSISMSKNSNSLAYKEYSKLFISSPVNWVVSDIMVDLGEDVSVWTPLIKLASIWNNEIEIWLSFQEVDLIKVWTKVKITYIDKEIDWNISSISPIADNNLNYKAKVSINSKVNISWNIVDVIIPVNLEKKLIPLEVLKVKSDKMWEINILKDDKIVKIVVDFGWFYWDKVEILGCTYLNVKECEEINIITNDISKFDENKFSIIKK